MKAIKILEMPNGRHLEQYEDGTWGVQPPNDNWFATGKTAREALEKAGWKLNAEILPDVTEMVLPPPLTGQGGPGRGQGRKEVAPALKKISRGVRLSAWVWEWLKTQDQSEGALLEAALVKVHKLKPPTISCRQARRRQNYKEN